MQIRIEQLTKRYGKNRGIENISVELPERGFTAIVGPSGCGKTTLLRTLAGFLQADSGQIWFGDRNVTYASPQHRGAGMVFQNYALWPHMSVFDNVAYGLKLKKVPAREREQKVYDVLKRVEIDPAEVKKRHPQHYSGGQQQRIALARALVIQPDLLLMDEPLSNLDAKVRQRLRVEIRSIQQSFGITALYVTHDQEEALSMADYVIVMNEGRVEQAGTPEEVYRKPATYFTAQFLGDSHTLEVKRGNGTAKLVVRSGDARIGAAISGNSGDQQMVNEDETEYRLIGEIKKHLFIGSCYRHMVQVGSQILFVDDEQIRPVGMHCIHIPKDKANWFASSDQSLSNGETVNI